MLVVNKFSGYDKESGTDWKCVIFEGIYIKMFLDFLFLRNIW